MENIFKSNLIFLREGKEETQAETATALGLSRSTYANYEAGENFPKADVLMKIIGHFGVNFEQIMSENLENAYLLQKQKGQNLQGNEYPNASPSAYLMPQNSHDSHQFLEPEATFQKKEIIRPVMVTVDHQGRENIVMVPVKARAGYLNGYGDPEFIQSLPAYRLPGLHHGIFRMFEVQGLSMYQTLYDKDIVIGEYVEQAQLIRDDRVHIIVTNDYGVVIKRVLNRVRQDGKLILKSDNHKDRALYPPIVLNPEDVFEIWYCKMRLTPQFATSDLYTRLVDMEGRVTMLEEQFKNNPKM